MILNLNLGRKRRSNLLSSLRNEPRMRQPRSGQTPLRSSQTPTRTQSDPLPFSSDPVRPGLTESDLISPKTAPSPRPPEHSIRLSNLGGNNTRFVSFLFMPETMPHTLCKQ